MNGWIKLHRCFLDWEWFDRPNMVHLFLYLLLSANHADGKWHGIEVKRGQIITGISSINKATGISIQSIRTFLKCLQMSREINIKSTNKFTMITICNYDSYQDDNNGANKQLTNKQQTTNNKQEEEEGKEREYWTSFETFWEAFHQITGKRKEKKMPAEKKWKQLTVVEKKLALEMIEPFSKSNEEKYLQIARTYLGDKTFNDEFDMKPKTRGATKDGMVR